MHEYVYIGKIVNTHGIKGELRILSNFERKNLIFKPDFKLYIGLEKEEEIINTYRPHKEFDMITLKNYTNINDVLKYKGKMVYAKRADLHLQENEYLYEDLIGMRVVENEKTLGKIKEIVYNKSNILLLVWGDKKFYIPLQDAFIKQVDLKNRIVLVDKGRDLML